MIATVDIAVVVDGTALLLIRRAKPPFMDRLVLPGGHVEEGETFVGAAARELYEETGVIVTPEQLRPLMTLDAPGRDPRPGRRVSRVFVVAVTKGQVASACADSDAAEIVLRPLASLQPEDIGFDHFTVVEALRVQ